MIPIITPSTSSTSPSPSSHTSVVLPDDRAIQGIIWQLLDRAGLSQTEACRRLGLNPDGLQRFRNGRCKGMTLKWLAKFAAVCGGKVVIEFPDRPVQ